MGEIMKITNYILILLCISITILYYFVWKGAESIELNYIVTRDLIITSLFFGGFLFFVNDYWFYKLCSLISMLIGLWNIGRLIGFHMENFIMTGNGFCDIPVTGLLIAMQIYLLLLVSIFYGVGLVLRKY